MHEFDASNDPTKPWRWCETAFCRAVSDRTSATLVNRHTPHLYPEGCGGFVLAAKEVQQLCSYYSDGGSNRIICRNSSRWTPSIPKDALLDDDGQCIPGCGETWCADQQPQKECHAGCAWRPGQLMQMMQQQEAVAHRHTCLHNEVVLRPIHKSLPFALDAVFIKSSCLGTGESARVKRLHSYMLRRFRLSAASMPFVVYHSSARTAAAFQNATSLVRGDEDLRETLANATPTTTARVSDTASQRMVIRAQARTLRRNGTLANHTAVNHTRAPIRRNETLGAMTGSTPSVGVVDLDLSFLHPVQELEGAR